MVIWFNTTAWVLGRLTCWPSVSYVEAEGSDIENFEENFGIGNLWGFKLIVK